MDFKASFQPIVNQGKAVAITSMVTEYIGRRYRSTVNFSDGQTRVSYGENAMSAESNVLRGLELDWTQQLPDFSH